MSNKGYRKDLTGERFERITVIKYAYTEKGRIMWMCACDCGKLKITRGSHLVSGKILSCGCLAWHKMKKNKKLETHGQGHSRGHGKPSYEYKTWQMVKQRCLNTNDKNFSRYGGRGIKVCDEWLDFNNFYRDMGVRPRKGLSIDRVDNDKGYSKENCRWATAKEQQNNTRVNVFIEYNGEKLTISQWSRKIGMKDGTLRDRLKKHNWPIEEALTKPVKKYNKNR